MAAKRKAPGTPDYPLPSLEEYEALSPQEKLRLLEVLRAKATTEGSPQLDKLFEKLPNLIERCIEIYTKHFGERTKITLRSLWAHVGVLLLGTGAVLWLGLEKLLDGATVVAILGPLYTYVLVNLRHLTVGNTTGQSADG